AGVEGADARCQAEAEAEGWTGTFVALIATDGAAAVSRLNLTGPSWFRPDGLRLVDHPLQLLGKGVSSTFEQAAVDIRADGLHRQTGYELRIWTGAPDLATPGSPESTCSDWTAEAPSATGMSAQVISAANMGFSGWPNALSCAVGARIMCFQND
ncbi:MAG: hypothetical protein H6740_29415, partial [Alphaproteobacteria bacterium]|nr:hypothetical protein [Alphaproteobacteria bacterium]